MTPAEFKTTREALGLTQPDICRAFGVAVRTVRNWETGATRVPPIAAMRIIGMEMAMNNHARRLADSEPTQLVRYRETPDGWLSATHYAALLWQARQILAARGVQCSIVFD